MSTTIGCPIPGASQPKLKTCSGCKYWKTLIGVWRIRQQ